MEQYAKIQQILKKEEGQKERKPIYPPTVIQAVFDAKTGASLEAILAQFNSIYVQYQGTPQATRCIIPEEMRRAGLTITYMNMDSETITERAASAVQKDNDHWGLDINWSRVDELSLSGDISVSAQGTWIINGEDTGIKALGPKGDAGLTPWLKTIDNKLHFSYDNVNWEPCSEPIAAYFRFNDTSGNTQSGTIGKIQISRDNKTWNDLSPEFTNNLHIAGYVATTSALPANKPVGTIYGVGPTYATEDTAQTNPIYRLYVYNGTTWVDNGQFTSISAGIVQETGDSETEVMSQKATTEKLTELATKVENYEYIRAYIDKEGKFLWGIKQDGSIEWSKGVPAPIKKYIDVIDLENDKEIERINQLVIELTNTIHFAQNEEWIHVVTDAEGKILMGIKNDGKKYFSGQEMFEKYNDIENRIEMILDADNKILSYRDSDGVKYENKMSVNTFTFEDHVVFKGNSLNEFEKALKESGFSGGTGDWSEKKNLQINIPNLAMVNISGINSLPTSKTSNSKAVMEFWDMKGNYFKKNIILNVQGDTSRMFDKKNFSFDLCNDDWIGDDTFEIKFGNWVTQDSFHLKAGASDALKAVLDASYQFCEKAISYFNARPSRLAYNNTTTYSKATGNMEYDYNTGALCHPDGFPCIMYFNGDFYGIYAFNLKKHRSNYLMDKNDYESVIIDGFTGSTFFGGTIDWTLFELKNPKTLYCMDGSKYDGDNPKELIDNTSQYYDSGNEDHVNTAVTKNVIISMSNALTEVYTLPTIEEQKAKFEDLFDIESLTVLFIMLAALGNMDSVIKNTLWCKWKNGKIAPCFYDLDSGFGHSITTQMLGAPLNNIDFLLVDNFPTKFLYDNYKDKIVSYYTQLKEVGILSSTTLKQIFERWTDNIGYENYKKEFKKWETPSYRESYLNSEYWSLAIESEYEIYDDTKEYQIGDVVSAEDYNHSGAIKYRCKKPCIGIPPVSKYYTMWPKAGGCFESLERLLMWFDKTIENLNNIFTIN